MQALMNKTEEKSSALDKFKSSSVEANKIEDSIDVLDIVANVNCILEDADCYFTI